MVKVRKGCGALLRHLSRLFAQLDVGSRAKNGRIVQWFGHVLLMHEQNNVRGVAWGVGGGVRVWSVRRGDERVGGVGKGGGSGPESSCFKLNIII